MSRAHYEPSSVVASPPLVGYAVVVGRDDAAALMADHGARVIGTIRVDGNVFACQGKLAQKASEEGAKRGGTHVVRLVQGETAVQLTQDRVTADCQHSGNASHCTGTVQPGMRGALPSSGWAVLRVEASELCSLRPEYRPLGACGD
jgi:hypothetical protein